MTRDMWKKVHLKTHLTTSLATHLAHLRRSCLLVSAEQYFWPSMEDVSHRRRERLSPKTLGHRYCQTIVATPGVVLCLLRWIFQGAMRLLYLGSESPNVPQKLSFYCTFSFEAMHPWRKRALIETPGTFGSCGHVVGCWRARHSGACDRWILKRVLCRACRVSRLVDRLSQFEDLIRRVLGNTHLESHSKKMSQVLLPG